MARLPRLQYSTTPPLCGAAEGGSMTRRATKQALSEVPADYPLPHRFVRPMDYQLAARATRDQQMLEAVQRQIRLQDMRDNLPRYRDWPTEVVSSAFVVAGCVLGLATLALGLVAFFAPQWLPVLPWTAVHTAGVIYG
jgi:hypothetical protein